MVYQTWQSQRDEELLEETPEAKSDFNQKKKHLENLHEKNKVLQELMVGVKLGDRNCILKFKAQLEVVFEIIKPPLKYHFNEVHAELINAFEYLNELYSKAAKYFMMQPIPMNNTSVIAFIEGCENVFSLLNDAQHRLGLGITVEKNMSKKSKIANALE